jgi:hypothetical protein
MKKQRNNKEYIVCKQIATYLRLQFPKVIFHFDLAGLNLSRAQASMMKGIQGKRGWPDLFIAQRSFQGEYLGLFIEIKPEGTRLLKLNGDFSTPHIQEQNEMIHVLQKNGYYACFAIGFDNCIKIIDEYLKQ